MDAPFEVIDHTADIGIMARGRDLNELFANAAAGMLYLMAKEAVLQSMVTREIELEAGDLEALLVEWLNELLYILDTEGILLSKFDIVITGTRLAARCTGEKLDPKQHRLRREVKAATYHDLRIIKTGEVYSVKIIFDI